MPNFELNKTLRQDCFEVAELPLCKILMLNDQQYPWFILVPRIPDITEIYQLSNQQQQQLLTESDHFGKWLMDEFKGDKLNVAAIGNVVSQLHIHHIVRYKDDACWPKPVWGAKQAIPFGRDVAGDRIETVKSWVRKF